MKQYSQYIRRIDQQVEDEYIQNLRMGCYRERNQSLSCFPHFSSLFEFFYLKKFAKTTTFYRRIDGLARTHLRRSGIVGASAKHADAQL